MKLHKVFLDPGHGGNDSGANGNNQREKDINLQIALRVKYHLERHDINVKLTREYDKTVSLEERSFAANDWDADLFVSIHCNAFNGSAYGLETYCFKFAYRKLADLIHRELIKAGLYYLDRGVKEGNYHVIRETKMDAALVEMAFIDNIYDVELLKNKKEQFAAAITKGILTYLNLEYVEEVIKAPEVNKKIRRVVLDGNQIGAYSETSNILNEVKKAIDKGTKKIEINLV